MQKKEIFPDFLIAGATKCGSTSLYSWLDQHPDIYMTKPWKEPAFFDAEFHKGRDFYWNKYYGTWGGEKLAGEANVRNLSVPFVAERIHSVNPDAKLIILMRNPVDRALSHWWHLSYRYSKKREMERLSFEDALMENYERLKKGLFLTTPEEIRAHEKKILVSSIGLYRTYLDSGHYAENIEAFLRFFPRKNFKFLLFDDLVKDPLAITKDVCGFLGVDRDVCDGFDYTPQNQALRMKLNKSVVHVLKNLSPRLVADIFIKGFDSAVRQRPRIKPELRAWLVEYYRPHNKRLEEFLGRSLSHWNSHEDAGRGS